MAQQQIVKSQDPQPVCFGPGSRIGMTAGYRRLQLIATGPMQSCRGREVAVGATDRDLVPPAAILIFQQHQPTLIIEAGLGAGVQKGQQGQ